MIRTVTLCLLLSSVVAFDAAAAPRLRWSHTRPINARAAQLVADASARSSVVTALIDSLETTDVVVFVQDSIIESERPRAYLRFVAYAAGTRYLLVHLDRWRATPPECAAWLAHELQHALEIAAAPDVRDAEGLARLYRRIGWETRPDRFESDLAQEAGARVRSELAGLDPRRRKNRTVR